MFTSTPEHRKSVKPHTCTWCGQSIGTSERYYRWFSLDEDATMGVSKMHPECKPLTMTERAIKAQPELATVWNV